MQSRTTKNPLTLKELKSLPGGALSPPPLSLPSRGVPDSELGGSVDVGVVGRGSSCHWWSHFFPLEAQSITETEI